MSEETLFQLETLIRNEIIANTATELSADQLTYGCSHKNSNRPRSLHPSS